MTSLPWHSRHSFAGTTGPPCWFFAPSTSPRPRFEAESFGIQSAVDIVVSPIRRSGIEFLPPRKMRKRGVLWLRANLDDLPHLIFVDRQRMGKTRSVKLLLKVRTAAPITRRWVA
jgi:hypothetical protein